MMEISFDITEREQKLDDGSTVVAFFNKRERFKNYIPYTSILLWDQVQNYGRARARVRVGVGVRESPPPSAGLALTLTLT